jgi:hypothetical protein
MRGLLAATLLGTALAVPLAAAAPAPCTSIADPTNDATAVSGTLASPKSDTAMDVDRVAIATDATRVTVVLHVYGLTAVDTMAPTGRLFDVDFTVRGAKKHLRVVIDATGRSFADPGADHMVDTAGYEIHVTMSLARLGLTGLRGVNKRSKLKPDVVTELGATTQRWRGDLATGQAVDGTVVDTARGAIAYVHKTPSSCVKVGQ